MLVRQPMLARCPTPPWDQLAGLSHTQRVLPRSKSKTRWKWRTCAWGQAIDGEGAHIIGRDRNRTVYLTAFKSGSGRPDIPRSGRALLHLRPDFQGELHVHPHHPQRWKWHASVAAFAQEPAETVPRACRAWNLVPTNRGAQQSTCGRGCTDRGVQRGTPFP